MSGKLKIFLAVAAIAVLAWVAKTVFFPPNENQKIERILKEAVATFADKKATAVTAFLTDDFSSKYGTDKESVLNYLRQFFFQVRELKASIEHLKHENEKLEKSAVKARVLLVVKVAGKVNDQPFQGLGGTGVDALALTMRKVEDKWLVAVAELIDTSDPLKAFEQLK